MAGVSDTTGMIALVPAPEDVARLTVPGGDPADELHLTLAFLGEHVDQDYDPAARAALADQLRRLAAATAPTDAHAMGHSVFNPTGARPATVYMVTGADLPGIREEVAEHEHSEHPLWLPHVTAGYGIPVDTLDYTGPVRFDRLRLTFGDDVADFPLTGAPAPDYDAAPAEPERDDVEVKAGPGVAGVALMAADTGRVLMIQRALDDPKDPAAGTWEFPGGHLERGDATSLHGGIREWQEEIGHPMPEGGTVAHTWTSPNGKYQGHVVVIDSERDLDLGAKRSVRNPDDDAEQAAWWDPADARKNPALRTECRATPWAALGRALATVRDNTEGKALTPVADLEFKAGDSHTPPAGVRAAAQRGLDLVKAGRAGQNFTDVGRKRAADLARGAAVSTETAKRMKAYFDRHRADRGAHWGKAGAETPGYVAWQCWGGDAGYAWARKIVKQVGEKGAAVEDYGDVLDDLFSDVDLYGDVEVKARPEAREPVQGSGAAPSQIPAKGKRKVASKAGEARYGLPIGTELGKARDEKAKAAQSDKGAQGLYESLSKVDPAKYREHLDKLSPADLQKLSRLLYAGKSSNPAIVKARVAIAGALRRRGMDVNDNGGLGKSSARKPARAAAKPKLRKGVDYVDLDDNVSDAQIAKLKAQGWKGRAGDGAERLYRPGAKGIDEMGAEFKGGNGNPFAKDDDEDDDDKPGKGAPFGGKGKPFGKGGKPVDDEDDDEPEGEESDGESDDDEDDDPDAKGPPWEKRRPRKGEEKSARTTTKPWEKRKAQRAGDTIGKDKSTDSDGGDEYPIRTIGDVAAAIKRCNKISNPERKKTVRAHIRAGAKKINATNMIPKDWGSGGSEKKSGAPEFSSVAAFADYIESKVMSPDPRAVKLREYWAHGEGRKKWRPGSSGDFERLRRQLRKHVPMHMLNGLTANIHKLATGEWPGKNAHGGKAKSKVKGKSVEDWTAEHGAGDGDVEVLTPAELTQFKAAGEGTAVAAPDLAPAADPGGPDDLNSALDRYSEMADLITTPEEYEAALADQIDWDLLPPAELVRSDWEPERGPGRPSILDADEDYDIDAMLDELGED